MNVGESENWADNAGDVSAPASPAPASPAPALLSREVPSALSGVFVNVGFREKKPTKAQKKEARNQAKLAEAQHQAELAETERLKNEARKETFHAESIRIELEAQRRMKEEEEEQRRRESLGEEYDVVQPFIWAHLGITREQFIASPDNCRARIAELQNPAQQEEFEQEEEKSANPVPCVTIHTPNKSHMEGLCRQAQQLNITLTPYPSGNHLCVDISECDMQMLIVNRWNQHIWVSAKQGGYKVQVGRGSYQALMEIRPDVASIVHEAMELQDQLDHRKQGLVSQPYCPQYYQYHAMGASPFVIVPVLYIHGNVMCLQQVSRYA
jgi:frataxin-like iron-binding protein CyaY